MATRRLPAAERKRQIAEAALAILGSRGVRHLTAVKLARSVGVTDATLFRHFASMEAIIDAAIAIVAEELEPPLPEGPGDPLERLGAFVTGRVEQWQQRPELLRLLTSDRLIDAAGAAGATRIGGLRQRSERFVAQCLEQAQRQGSVARDLSPKVLTWMLRGAIHGSVAGGGAPDRRSTRSRRPAVDSPSAAAVWSTVRALLERSASAGPR